ncbi:MAG: hypothetical protein EBS84_08515 [Proteobacteria bacterium]|nr:hypothetical protein [Verrucomicrobiota bacterium]NBU09043.1 hypothetical protein [Pseudomonadota bacterium]
MRSLAQPAVLWRAAIAGVLTAAAGYPRLANWTQRPDALWFLDAALGWAGFVMWAAVLAWHRGYSGHEVFPRQIPGHLWWTAGALGVGGAIISYHWGDPLLRQLAPTDFPRTPGAWVEHLLFSLALEQVFLCFAPVAFLVRLWPNVNVAATGTVLFSLFVFTLKLDAGAAAVPGLVLAGMFLFRALHSGVTVWLYLRGGAWLVWFFATLLLTRLWFSFAG